MISHRFVSARGEQEAKADIVDGDRTKLQLEGDVRLLYDLLERAKKERRCYGAVVKGLERSLAVAEEKRTKVGKSPL